MFGQYVVLPSQQNNLIETGAVHLKVLKPGVITSIFLFSKDFLAVAKLKLSSANLTGNRKDRRALTSQVKFCRITP